MKITTQEISRVEWDTFISSYSEANFLHSWQWGELHTSLGLKVYRYGYFETGQLVGILLAIVRPARRGRYLEVPGGPLLNWNNENLTQFFVQHMQQLGANENCVFVRVRPQLEDTINNKELMKKLGFKKAGMHLHAEHTSILDLNQTTEELLSNMRKQTRYEIRQAEKQGITVSKIVGTDLVDEFYKIQQDTAKKQGFIAPTKTFLRAQTAAFGDDIQIYQTKKGKTTLALAMIIFYGDEADYHEGASTLEGRSTPGAYALQWQAIQDAKKLGKKRYNFFGIAPNNNKKHRYAGVTTFKRGFGGADYTYIPAQDLVLKKVKYIKNWAVEHVRKKVRKL